MNNLTFFSEEVFGIWCVFYTYGASHFELGTFWVLPCGKWLLYCTVQIQIPCFALEI